MRERLLPGRIRRSCRSAWNTAPLFQAVEAAFGDVALFVELLVEGWRAPAAASSAEPVSNLVGPFRDGVPDTSLSEPDLDGFGAVALVAQDVVGPNSWLSRPKAGTRIVSITAVNWVQSLVFPPVTAEASGRPRASQARWILLVSPPQKRPSAELPPFRAPTACWRARTAVESTDTSQSMPPAVRSRLGGPEHPVESALQGPPAKPGVQRGPRAVPQERPALPPLCGTSTLCR